MKKLKSLAEKNGNLDKPVFMFDSGSLLTTAKLNKIIQLHLFPHIGQEARFTVVSHLELHFQALWPQILTCQMTQP
jgi:hypothetical protein